MGWKEIKLRDFIELQRGHDLTDEERIEGNVPVIGSAGINGYHNIAKYKGPGVTIGRSGASIGFAVYTESDYWPHNACLFVKDFKGNEPKYVFYLLKTYNFDRLNSGSAQASLNRNFLYPLILKVPDTLTQRKIATILSAYDDLIENNKKRIKLLEEMAEEIYKEWFVRMRFPGYEKTKFFNEQGKQVPHGTNGALLEGWEKVKLEYLVSNVRDVVTADENLWHSSKKYLPIDLIPRKSMYLPIADSILNAQSSLIGFKKYDILFGAMRAYFHKVIVAPFDGVTRSTCFVLRPRDSDLFSFVYLTLFQDKVVNYAAGNSKGSTIPYSFWEGGLNKYEVLCPPKELIAKFNTLIKPQIEFIIDSHFKNLLLQETRDLLLPRLMSGKLNVENLAD